MPMIEVMLYLLMEEKNKVIGRCQVVFPRLPQLDEVLHVEGLKSNLISIS